ncbi:peptide-methionine (S)-S-oxide reductase MsrA [Rufibacter glacialis]|uniref:Peptide methionine sulfoxide reductase MsrA n=1 Tax=Rufibacter glacialis TaxID=1259555 RepID=A0A5M8Q6T3_9BACT|nr:peptide-methionine (S)-S-oxide reductase MsrA [Rufibacter glacialis]KAA6431645.1 peptide-methionine (S)-S-oxide reductase MsrA [Rufibacter glacialis]GGK82724.1 hypothetical protein GCM10011405_33160 [Rufibacter glacialis]
MKPLPETKIPAMDQVLYPNLQTATLAMGCFWGAEAYFGAVGGVVRTRVGFAGGTTENPTYRTLADHIEVVQLEFNPKEVTYGQLLERFFNQHTPTKEPRKRQYTSAIFFHNPEQEEVARQVIKEAEGRLQEKLKTEMHSYKAFYLAEERHQKWKLRRVPEVLQELQKIYPDPEAFNNSPAVARVNGYVAGIGEKERFMEEMGSLGLSYPVQQVLLAHFLAQELGGFSFKL